MTSESATNSKMRENTCTVSSVDSIHPQGEDQPTTTFEATRQHHLGSPHQPELQGDLDQWIQAAKREIEAAGFYLAFLQGETEKIVQITKAHTRIGRSLGADIRFDDPTVSRRHALLFIDVSGVVQVLDDRSLNGIFVNGVRVENAVVKDGDTITVGRHRLHLLVIEPQ